MDSTTLRTSLQSLSPRKPLVVGLTTPVQDVINLMKDNSFGCVVVTEKDALVGIISERDVLTKVVGGHLDVNVTTAGDIMTHRPEYLWQDDEIAYAVNRMHVGGFRHIPLLDLKGAPTGVISVRDVLAYIVESLD